MSFLRGPKVIANPTTPTNVQDPSVALQSLARLRRLQGGRNAFDPSQTGPTGGATVTGVSG